uniref:Uncharacterized protein n=1 Tax=Glossina brevipalpis TaxID=37001 RepID=A0A1A9W5T5_9MUSC
MKFALALLFVCALAGSQAQYVPGANPGMGMGMGMGAGMGMGMGMPPSPFGGLSAGYFFQVVVLQTEAEKLLSKPDLPEDLRQRVMDILSNSGEAFDSCSTVAPLPWLQIRCASMQMKTIKNQLKAIEAEATARAQLAASAGTANVPDICISVE